MSSTEKSLICDTCHAFHKDNHGDRPDAMIDGPYAHCVSRSSTPRSAQSLQEWARRKGIPGEWSSRLDRKHPDHSIIYASNNELRRLRALDEKASSDYAMEYMPGTATSSECAPSDDVSGEPRPMLSVSSENVSREVAPIHDRPDHGAPDGNAPSDRAFSTCAPGRSTSPTAGGPPSTTPITYSSLLDLTTFELRDKLRQLSDDIIWELVIQRRALVDEDYEGGDPAIMDVIQTAVARGDNDPGRDDLLMQWRPFACGKEEWRPQDEVWDKRGRNGRHMWRLLVVGAARDLEKLQRCAGRPRECEHCGKVGMGVRRPGQNFQW